MYNCGLCFLAVAVSVTCEVGVVACGFSLAAVDAAAAAAAVCLCLAASVVALVSEKQIIVFAHKNITVLSHRESGQNSYALQFFIVMMACAS